MSTLRKSNQFEEICVEITQIANGRYQIECNEDQSYVLGVGAFGKVFKAKDTKLGIDVAVKRQIVTDEPKKILWEVTMLKNVNHDNIIKLYDLHTDTNCIGFRIVYMVVEYMPFTLFKLIFESDTKLTEEHIAYFMWQLFLALYHLHTGGIIHRDIKPSNILLDGECNVKLCDFGLSRTGDIDMTKYVVTRYYRAPELIALCKYGNEVDMWSIACVMAELYLRKEFLPMPSARTSSGLKGSHLAHQLNTILSLIGTPPESDIKYVSSEKIRNYILQTKYTSTLESVMKRSEKATISDEALDLLNNLLQFNPSKRYSAEQALRHSWIKKYDYFEEDSINSSRNSPFDIDFQIHSVDPLYYRRKLLSHTSGVNDSVEDIRQENKQYLNKDDPLNI